MNKTGKGGRPRCTVCNSSHFEEINSEIRQGVPFRQIAKTPPRKFSHVTIYRHSTECLKLDYETLQKQKKKKAALNHHEILAKNYMITEELRTAAEEWLRLEDGTISLDPRSDEIMVVIREWVGGIPVNRAVPLQELLDEIRGAKKELIKVHVKDDNRQLILKYIQECRAHVDSFMKAQNITGDTPEAIAMAMLYIALEMAKRYEGMDVDTALRMVSKEWVNRQRLLEEG
jgi:hypothetical protein